MEIFLQADTWLALLTLIFLEVVLGIDNIIFISIVSNKLPEEQRKKARNTGLAFAMGVRVILLLGITWIIGLKSELFRLFDHGFSGRDLILIFGGLFLIAKSTMEINHEMEGEEDEEEDEVLGEEGSVHPDLEDEDEGEECLGVVRLGEVVPRVDDAQDGDERREGEQREGYPVDRQVVAAVDDVDPRLVDRVLQLLTGVVVEAGEYADRPAEGDERGQERDDLGRRLRRPGQEHDDRRAH